MAATYYKKHEISKGETIAQSLNERFDYEQIHKEMQKSGVTLSLLWVEYCEQCRAAGELPYQSAQFNAEAVVRHFLTMYAAEQQGYRACMALLKLTDKYPPAPAERLFLTRRSQVTKTYSPS